MMDKISLKSSKHGLKFLFVFPSILVVILYYVWFVSMDGSDHGTTTHYFTRLADAFIDGRLYLNDIGKDIPIDLSFYNGKFYMYWGPVPALVLVPIQYFSNAPIGDFFLAFLFGIGLFITQSFLILVVWDRYFDAVPKWSIHLSILLVGLITPAITLRHHFDHARVYEAAIVGGQLFLIGGSFLTFSAITRSNVSNSRLVFAGLSWVLAVGTRHILAVPIGIMVMLTVFWLLRARMPLNNKIATVISFGLPLVLGAVALGWYNWARFGSIVETGFSYALASVDLKAHANEIFSSSYIFQNLFNYLLNPPGIMSKFPYIFIIDGNKNPILSFYSVPEFYQAEPTTGMLYMFPFAVFSIISLLSPFINIFKRNSVKTINPSDDASFLAWIELNLGVSFVITFGLFTLFFWISIRYLGDFIPSLITLSILGFWRGYELLSHKPLAQNMYVFIGLILAGSSILTSSLMAISTNPGWVNLLTDSFHHLKTALNF